jgi:hypothetical protein
MTNGGVNGKRLKSSVDYKAYLVLVLKISVNVGLLIVKQESGLLTFSCFLVGNGKQYW